MRTIRRIRNVAFFGLVVTLAWAHQVGVRADPFCSFTPYLELDPPPQRYWEVCNFATCNDAFAACDALCNRGVGWMEDFTCEEQGESTYGVCTCSWPHGG